MFILSTAGSYIAIALAFVVIVLAARGGAQAGWQRAGMACLALALLIQGSLGNAPQGQRLAGFDLSLVANALFWIFFATMAATIGREIIRRRRSPPG